MKINSINHSETDNTASSINNKIFGILNVPMMTDEEWSRIASSPEQVALRKKLYGSGQR